jgi:hypothetical protein
MRPQRLRAIIEPLDDVNHWGLCEAPDPGIQQGLRRLYLAVGGELDNGDG